MPEEPPAPPPSKTLLMKTGKGGVSEGSDQSASEGSGESSSSEDSESESERASQLSYLQKQVGIALFCTSSLLLSCFFCVTGNDSTSAVSGTSWWQVFKEIVRV